MSSPVPATSHPSAPPPATTGMVSEVYQDSGVAMGTGAGMIVGVLGSVGIVITGLIFVILYWSSTMIGTMFGVVGTVGMFIIGWIFVFLYRRGRKKRLLLKLKDNIHFGPPQSKAMSSPVPAASPLSSPPPPNTNVLPSVPYFPTVNPFDHIGNGMARGTMIGIIVGVVLASMLIIGGIVVFLHRCERSRGRVLKDNNHSGPKQVKDGEVGIPPTPNITTFTYEELAKATDGFSSLNLLGQGGFGYVHKGVLQDGMVVAVKQLKAESRQGEREFHAEVEVISRVHHRHLVSLVGYCISGVHRMLVYEYLPNKTLEFHLHGKEKSSMEWSTRLKIAIGSAKGLAYLHEDCHPKIIHRDIKAANILLDDNFEAKVADFGLAKFWSDADTHVSTRVMGTFGYLAPEYAASGKLTEKSDVYSFGVVLLELITGRKPVDKTASFTDDSMVEWAKPLLSEALENGNVNGLVDPSLGTNYNLDEMIRMIACASRCILYSARHRTQMSQVVLALEGNISLEDLNKESTPGHNRVLGSFESSSFDSDRYNENLKKFEKLALESKEQGTSDFSESSSKYSRHLSASTSSNQQNTQEIEMANVMTKHGSGPSGVSP